MLRAGFLILGFFLIVHQAWNQPRFRQSREKRFMHYEAINLVSRDSSNSRVDILYRISHGFFVPVKNTDHSFPWNFKRRGEVLVELIDSLGVSKARNIHRFDIGTDQIEESSHRKDWYQGIVSFNVSPGLYKVLI